MPLLLLKASWPTWLLCLVLLCIVFAVAACALPGQRASVWIGTVPPPTKRGSRLLFGFDRLHILLDVVRERRFLAYAHDTLTDDNYTIASEIAGRTTIVTADIENVKALLSAQFSDFGQGGSRRAALAPLMRMSIFASDGAPWVRMRTLLRSIITADRITDFSILERHVDNLLRNLPPDGRAVDLRPTFHHLMLDVATEFLFGQSAGILSNSLARARDGLEFSDTIGRVEAAIFKRLSLGRVASWLPDPSFSSDCSIVHGFVYRYVRQAIEHNASFNERGEEHDMFAKDTSDEAHSIFLQALATGTKDSVELRDNAMAALLASRDTTSNLLSNTFWVLSRRPDVWSRLRMEVDQLGDRRPTAAELRNMKYLRWTINEGT